MAIHIVEEAERCLGCKKPQCQQGCPVHTNIPEVIRLFKDRKINDVGAMLFENNPMSAVCSLICNHSAQCEGHCIRGRKDSPVHFSAIENYISSNYLDRMRLAAGQPTGKRVAVIGSGPASLVVAMKLALAGVEVTVFERQPDVGGVLRYGIPEYRLPKSLISKYRDRLDDLGVRVRPNTTIGEAIDIDDLFRDGYDAVFAGTGTWRAKTAGVPGEAGGNVLFGMDYLVSPDTCSIGDRVAVIGAGNTAMDVARTALRQGAREVTLYARSKHISASTDELEYAQLDGAELVVGKAIASIDDTGATFRTAIFDEDDKVIGYEDELDHVECDTVIVAVSQKPRNVLITTTEGLEGDERGLLIVDESGATTRPGVFAAGDVVTGPKTVVHAVEAAKRAADGMLAYLGVSTEKAEDQAL
ncbi:MAG: NAD(P)-dependent oxidoreductase [Atopobiaceae bacterium]|nr:NAD(P)-dependent oxidoreductase [Atopobiaceae bacterium]MBR1828688.1 NAD(P)-dependent oxidoreductase [Atopobiaceae bacterium]